MLQFIGGAGLATCLECTPPFAHGLWREASAPHDPQQEQVGKENGCSQVCCSFIPSTGKTSFLTKSTVTLLLETDCTMVMLKGLSKGL